MGGIYCDMKATFDSWSKDASSVTTGVAELTGVAGLSHKDEVWNVLTRSNENTEIITSSIIYIVHSL